MDAKISKRTISSSSMGKLSNRTLRALAIAILLKIILSSEIVLFISWNINVYPWFKCYFNF